MQLLRFLAALSPARIAAVVVAGLICGAANTYLVTLINAVVSPKPQPDQLLLRFALTGLVILVSGVASQVLLIRLSQDAIYRLRSDLSSGIVSAPLEHLERLGMHRLMATLTEDVRSLSQAVTAIPSICVDVATIVGCFVFLAIVSGPIFAVTVAGTLVGIACVELVLKRVRGIYREARENEDALLRSFQSVTLGIKELKLHRGRRRDFMDRHLLGSASSLREQNTDAGSKFSYAQGFGQALQLATMALILFVVAAALNLPRDTMVGYVLVTTFLAMPMQNFMHRIPDLLRGDVALAKIRAMNLSMETLHNEELLPYTERPAVGEAKLELTDVSYVYRAEAPSPVPPPPGAHPPGPPARGGHPPRPGRPPHAGDGRPGGPHPAHPVGGPQPDVNGKNWIDHGGSDVRPLAPPPGLDGSEDAGFRLGPIDLVFEPGQITFIVGGNGSGKSTLAKLITGLYVPRSGSLSLNGERIDHDNIEWFRQNSSAVFTDFHLFEDYLGFDRPGIDAEVQRYLEELQIAHKVTVRDGKLSTVDLSQGQRKRLALLTALLEDRQIYVFDEWAADQEPRFREVFYREILTDLKRRGKTVIVITHDDRYFDCADQLVKLDFGLVAV
ncbi:ATP-binding cassette domain-containing protein [Nocardia asteroides]|uniref:ABC transporter permease/ATP-binding protein n=1 Tax=Nocardia asteroides NBRC 15531 TaxID=1110697 RepID=U5EIY2_NOCAS|nr:ATP-binding cassette domain-containing protein [Nocardia asteroides]TLF67156.1 ATP-binding cassette domain-containing protein [Nocardia asteroides NBRC 15531]UGT51563.1 ATP-binding cassette domain-containing protein [Nocardia asteroides]SFM23133.1 putative ATP-binding cassette transporter [Nocardia asteroides]VEG35541.1 ABC transporter ATP-binding protein YojI [Nocardia asteroides]GAD86298.1 putative ABC transporter permease/ATP-binding protein [Nocardia asteroides NBRC 15531]